MKKNRKWPIVLLLAFLADGMMLGLGVDNHWIRAAALVLIIPTLGNLWDDAARLEEQ